MPVGIRRPNQFDGLCHLCGGFVRATSGFIDGQNSIGKWLIICSHCSGQPAPSPPRAPPKEQPTNGKPVDISVRLSFTDELRSVLKRWYRQASRRTHPDVPGGSTEKQSIVNDCYEILSEVFTEWDRRQQP
jgi:hypothetical protein